MPLLPVPIALLVALLVLRVKKVLVVLRLQPLHPVPIALLVSNRSL
jgi:hypothetical protein